MNTLTLSRMPQTRVVCAGLCQLATFSRCCWTLSSTLRGSQGSTMSHDGDQCHAPIHKEYRGVSQVVRVAAEFVSTTLAMRIVSI